MPAGYLESLYSLEGRVALVTGASSGIGRHMAGVLGKAGALVICLARRDRELQTLVDEISKTCGNAKVLTVDLLAEENWPKLAETVSKIFGPVDILVNAAGVNLRQPAENVTQDAWDRTLKLNLSVPFFLAQSLVPGMRGKGAGRIINIASLQSFRAFENGMAYGASKGGIAQLTRAMAEAWGRNGITANAMAPGFFPSELTAGVFADPVLADKHAAATAIGRNGELADLDSITVFLAAPGSAYFTGQVIAVDGGYLAK